jgi:hypothetical protein
MKLENHQSIVYRHTDTKHVHFHIITNRVSLDGQVAKDSFIKNRAAKVCDELEVEFNLTIARGHRIENHKDSTIKPLQVKNEIKEKIKKALNSNVKSIEELKYLLKKQDISMAVQYQSTGRINGISFSKNNLSFKGSSIDKSYSYKNILKEINLSKNKSNEYER